MRIKSIILALFILLFQANNSFAVLKGDDVNETVIMLSSELEAYLQQINKTKNDFFKAREDYKYKMQEFNKELISSKLSLYSQQEQYIFGNAYASENAQNLCTQFKSNDLQIMSWKTTYNRAITRCSQLKTTLSEINPNILNEHARFERNEGIKYLDVVLNDLNIWHDTIQTDLENYNKLVADVEALQTEIDKNYSYILNFLLLTPDKHPTHKVFSSSFPYYWDAAVATLTGIVASSNYYGWEFQHKWTAEAYFIFGIGLLAFILGLLLSIYVIFRHLPAHWNQARRYPIVFHVFCGLIAVAVAYFVIKLWFTTNPFYLSALNLTIEMCLLCIAVLFSVLLRVNSDKLMPTFLSYLPTVLLSLFIIICRITLVDINVIRVTYPLSLLIFIVAQIFVVLFLHRRMLRFDRYVSVGALALFLLCFTMNFMGYYYLSIYIALAWSLYVIGHLLLSCYYKYLERVEAKHREIDSVAYNKSWRPIAFNRLFKPMALIIVLFICTYQCARVFNINDWLIYFYEYKFIDYPGVVCISFQRIVHIVISIILLHSFIGMVNFLLRYYYKEKVDVGAMNLGRKIFAIVSWGTLIVVTLAYLEVNTYGIIATLGGLAVGLGVALRDTFDCLLCGIMLMMGRIKIGDVVEVGNEIRGKVVDIQYRATLIETDDGAIISVFNTQFFGKDFRNVSYSGKYQRLHLTFKVQKEIDSPKVRAMLAQALIDNVPELAKSPAPKILFGASDRFHVDMIAQVWVPIMDYYEAISNVKETLFNTLKEHGMSNMSVDSRVRLIKNIIDDDYDNREKKVKSDK